MAERDSLVNASPNMDENAPRKRRKRAPLSCEPCRRMKIKCDQNSPCNQCALRRKAELCVYAQNNSRDVASLTPQDARAARPNGASHSNQEPLWQQKGNSPSYFVYKYANQINESVPQTEASTIISVSHTSGTTPSTFHGKDFFPIEQRTSSPNLSNQDRYFSTPAPAPAASVQSLVDRVQQLEAQLSEATKTRNISPAAPGVTVIGTFNKTRLFGRSHWMNCIYEFHSMLDIRNELLADPNSEESLILDQCKKLARQVKAQIASWPLQPDFRDYIPSRDLSDRLVDSYFRTFESVYRVLHVPSFRQEYEQYWQNPQVANTVFVVKLLLVLAIGTSFQSDGSEFESRHSLALQCIYAAQSWLSLPNAKSRLNIGGLQVQCLLIIARQTCAVDGDLVWIPAGSLLRSAIHMGLHRDPSDLPKSNQFHDEMRRRLWATILELTVQSCMDTGGPPLITFQDFDCQPPANISDEDLEENMQSTVSPQHAGNFTQTSLQIMLFKSLSVRLQIAKLLNDFTSNPSYEEVLRLGKELTVLCSSNSMMLEAFSLNEQSNHAQQNAFRKNLLQLMTHRFLLALHHPWAIRARADPNYYYSRKVCTETALFLLHQSAIARSQAPGQEWDDYTCLIVYGGALYRAVILHASIICDLELIYLFQEDLFALDPSRGAVSRRELRDALANFKALLACRLRRGETNVQGYVFVAGVLAHVDAMEAHRPPKGEMMQAMLDALRFCKGILTARIEAITPRVEHVSPEESGPGADQLNGAMNWDEWALDTNLNFGVPESWLFPEWMPSEVSKAPLI